MSNEIWAYESQFKRGTRAYSPTKPSVNNAVRYVLANEADELRRQRDEVAEKLRVSLALIITKYGNLDKDVWQFVQDSQALLAQYEDGDA